MQGKDVDLNILLEHFPDNIPTVIERSNIRVHGHSFGSCLFDIERMFRTTHRSHILLILLPDLAKMVCSQASASPDWPSRINAFSIRHLDHRRITAVFVCSD